MSDSKSKQEERLLGFQAVSEQVCLGRSAIYSQIRRGTFPAPLKVTKHASRWLASEIDRWIKFRPRLGEKS